MRLSLEQILAGLPLAWSPETRGNEKYTGDHPAAGQCTVTSLLIQRHCGGDIIRCEVGSESWRAIVHYFNDINGLWVDATAGQFKVNAPRRKLKRNPDKSIYIFNDTWDRVNLLESKIWMT